MADGRALAGEGLPDDLLGSFDLVFVDAPCSGRSGTLARHPENLAWSLREEALPGLAALQAGILRAASARVAQGGLRRLLDLLGPRRGGRRASRRRSSCPAGGRFEPLDARRTDQPGSDTHFVARLRRR